MDTRSYLRRIDYSGGLKPSLTVLSALQEAHLRTVPFENLDIHAGKKIVLDPECLFDKIVVRRRGGFCYELNGLFNSLLRLIGFRTRMISARVYDRERSGFGPEFDHMAVLVDLDEGWWLSDVGFGDFTIRPLPFVLDTVLDDPAGQCIIERHDAEHFRVSKASRPEDQFMPEYVFSVEERELTEFTEMCLFHQSSPESHFTQKRVCTLATKSGRITLSDHVLIITDNGVRTELLIPTEADFARTLFDYFRIRL